MRRTVYGKGRRAKVLEPFNVDTSTWFYAEATGFTFVREVRAPDGRFIGTEMFKVPARMLRRSLALLASGSR